MLVLAVLLVLAVAGLVGALVYVLSNNDQLRNGLIALGTCLLIGLMFLVGGKVVWGWFTPAPAPPVLTAEAVADAVVAKTAPYPTCPAGSSAAENAAAVKAILPVAPADRTNEVLTAIKAIPSPAAPVDRTDEVLAALTALSNTITARGMDTSVLRGEHALILTYLDTMSQTLTMATICPANGVSSAPAPKAPSATTAGASPKTDSVVVAGAPADPAPAALNYDESNSDPLTLGQSRYVADYLREAMAANGTQEAMEQAIGGDAKTGKMGIQQEAVNAKAATKGGATLTLDQHQAWLVWCSDATTADFPTDTSDVFDKIRQGPGRVWIQVPFAEGVPLRSKDTFSGCNAPDGFWAVAVY